MDKKIKINGSAKAFATPDKIRVSATVTGGDKNYENTIKLFNTTMTKLKNCLKEADFDEKSLKTTGFVVNVKHENIRNDKGEYRQVFAGYEYNCETQIVTDSANKMLGKLFSALAKCNCAPRFRVQYFCSTVDKIKDELLAQTIAEVKAKAQLIAKSSGVKIKQIAEINYNFSDTNLRDAPSANLLLAKSASIDSVDITPSDIEIVDSVEMTFEIE